MSSIDENSVSDTTPSANFKLFAKNLVTFVLHHPNSWDEDCIEALYKDKQYAGVFSDYVEMRMAVLYIYKLYTICVCKVFYGIGKEDLGIPWFTEHVDYQRAAFINPGVDFKICLHFSVYMARLAANLHKCEVGGILEIAAEYIAAVFSSVVHSDGMETLEMVVQKYADLYHEEDVRESTVQQFAYEEDDEMSLSEYLDRGSMRARLTVEIINDFRHQHLKNDEIMDDEIMDDEIMDEEEQENIIPIQRFPFCDKSQTSSLVPAGRPMRQYFPENYNFYLDFSDYSGTFRDIERSIPISRLSFKRRISNESDESEFKSAKKFKTDCVISYNQDV